MWESTRTRGSPGGGRPRRVLLGALGAAVVSGAGLAAGVTLSPPSTGDAARARAGLGIVVRTPQHLGGRAAVAPLVERFARRGVERVWVQVKQDETEELPAGTAFYPSALAPVAPGFGDGRLDAFVGALDRRGIEPLAWMPVLHDEQAARAHPEWRSQRVDADGRVRTDRAWLCPFHPEVARHQAAIAAEVAGRYPALGGLYLDFIRYDDDYSCACPTCLDELEARTRWHERMGRELRPMDIRRAGETQDALWTAWTDLRAEKIVATVETIRAAVRAVRPGLPVSAFVLPFSSHNYQQNTQSGQDLARMARAGLDEIVLMGYWDDWDRDPAWVRDSLDAARRQIAGAAPLGVVLDGDMGVRRTRRTLEALGPWARAASWFHFSEWTEREFARLARAVDGHRAEGRMPRPDHVSVVIRVDTEPDDKPSYAAVRPAMVDALVRLFAREGVRATFVTVGRLAERQTAAIRRAAAAGHEIGSHSYDHEQLDALPDRAQRVAVDRGLGTLRRLGFAVHGFGAPRNSITDVARDRLIEWNLEYDGSDAYDPLRSLIDVRYEPHSDGRGRRIVVLPFVMPNDWDARYVGGLSARATAAAWARRLDRVVALGEPVFVLDVHQWAASRPGDLAALGSFIRHAKRCARCRIEPLRAAARHARRVLDRYELPAPTSGAGATRAP
jgi:peptidoglycan/xylan/chitin deacetylase (PgdA/CDA1 family)